MATEKVTDTYSCPYGSASRWRRQLAVLSPPLDPAWSPPPDTEFVDTPMLAVGLAFCVSREGKLLALDASTGRVAWQLETEPGWGVCQLSGDRLLSTPRPGVLVALDPRNGKERESHEIGDLLLGYAAVVGSRVIGPLDDDDGTIAAWDLSKHQYAWRTPSGWSATMLAADESTVCFSESKACVALDISTGAERWRFDATEAGRHTTSLEGERPGRVVRHPIVAGDNVFVGLSGGFIASLALDSGELEWRTHVGGLAATNYAYTPDGTVLFLGDDALVAIDAQSGDIRTRFALSGTSGGTDGPFSPLSVTDRFIWTVDRRGHLVAIARDTGRIDWRHDLRTRVASPPAIGDGRLFVTDLDGRLSVFAASL